MDRLVSMRHAEADERMVRLAWKSGIAALMLVECIGVSIAMFMYWPTDPFTSGLLAVGAPAIGFVYAYVFLRQLGAFGHYPTGLWGAASRRAFQDSHGEPVEQARPADGGKLVQQGDGAVHR